MREPFGGIGGQVVDVIEAMFLEEPGDKLVVDHRSFHKRRPVRDLIAKASAEVVKDNHLVLHCKTMPGDMRADEACTSCYE